MPCSDKDTAALAKPSCQALFLRTQRTRCVRIVGGIDAAKKERVIALPIACNEEKKPEGNKRARHRFDEGHSLERQEAERHREPALGRGNRQSEGNEDEERSHTERSDEFRTPSFPVMSPLAGVCVGEGR